MLENNYFERVNMSNPLKIVYMQKTFYEVSQDWSTAKRPIVKYSTMCAYLLILQKHLDPYFGSMKDITEDVVHQFVMNKLSSGHSKKSVRDMVAVLKSVVKYGRKQKVFTYDDWDIKYPTDTSDHRLPTLSFKNQQVLVRHIVKAPNTKNIGILLALYTGMRIGEVCALEWQDIDFNQKTITIRKTIGRVYDCETKSTQKIISTPKTKNSYREIPISNMLLKCLKVIRKEAKGTFVVGTSSTAQEPRIYRDYFNRLLKKLEIPKMVFHGLRHTFATRCIESQCDYKTVSAILGHSNIATTLNLYVHPNLNQKKKCIDRMSKFLDILE